MRYLPIFIGVLELIIVVGADQFQVQRLRHRGKS